jgi:hypothetical protein
MMANNPTPLLTVCIEIDMMQSEEILFFTPEELDEKLEHFYTVHNISNFPLRAKIHARIAASMALLVPEQDNRNSASCIHRLQNGPPCCIGRPNPLKTLTPNTNGLKAPKSAKAISTPFTFGNIPSKILKQQTFSKRQLNQIANTTVPIKSANSSKIGKIFKIFKNIDPLTNSNLESKIPKRKKISLGASASTNIKNFSQLKASGYASKNFETRMQTAMVNAYQKENHPIHNCTHVDNKCNFSHPHEQLAKSSIGNVLSDPSLPTSTNHEEICNCHQRPTHQPSIMEHLVETRYSSQYPNCNFEKSKFSARSETRLPEYVYCYSPQVEVQGNNVSGVNTCIHTIQKQNIDQGSLISGSFAENQTRSGQSNCLNCSWKQAYVSQTVDPTQMKRHNSICIQPHPQLVKKVEIEKLNELEVFEKHKDEVHIVQRQNCMIEERKHIPDRVILNVKEEERPSVYKKLSKENIYQSSHVTNDASNKRDEKENISTAQTKGDLKYLFEVLDNAKTGLLSRNNLYLRGLSTYELKILEPIIIQIYQETSGFVLDYASFVNMYRKLVRKE